MWPSTVIVISPDSRRRNEHRDVAGLEVAVNDTGFVRVVEGLCNGGAKLGCFAGRNPGAGKPLLEIGALDKIGSDKDRLVFPSDFVDAYDMRMTQLGRGTGLTEENLCLLCIELVVARDLQRHHAVELRVAGLPHAAELAGADSFDQLELSESSPFRPAPGACCFIADEAEVAAAGRAVDFRERKVVQDFDWVVAVRAATMHGETSCRGSRTGVRD